MVCFFDVEANKRSNFKNDTENILIFQIFKSLTDFHFRSIFKVTVIGIASRKSGHRI